MLYLFTFTLSILSLIIRFTYNFDDVDTDSTQRTTTPNHSPLPVLRPTLALPPIWGKQRSDVLFLIICKKCTSPMYFASHDIKNFASVPC